MIVANATGGSTAAPIYFRPKVQKNAFGTAQDIVDGGIIANNPALLSYMMQSKIKKKKPIRILSLGTGDVAFKGSNFDSQ